MRWTIPTPSRPVVFTRYNAASMAKLTDILRRSNPTEAIDEKDLEQELVNLFHATGIGRENTEAAALWHDGQQDRSREFSRQFLMMANADNPLDPSVCTPELRPYLNFRLRSRTFARLRQDGRGDRVYVGELRWEDLSEHERARFRDLARHLSAFHRGMVLAKRPRKDTVDSALLLLAEVYVRHTNPKGNDRELPHSVGALFVAFAREALRPFFDPSEVSATAIARRWQRLKREFRDARP